MNNQQSDSPEYQQYQELCSSWRHDDSVFDRYSAIILPLCFVGLVIPYIEDAVPAILSSFIGLVGTLYWFLTGINYQARSDIRWERIHEIEKSLGFNVHRWMHQERQKRGTPIRHKHWRWVIFIFYGVTAVIVCLHKHWEDIARIIEFFEK